MSYELGDFGQSMAASRAAVRQLGARVVRNKLLAGRRRRLPLHPATRLSFARRLALPAPSRLGDLPEPELMGWYGQDPTEPEGLGKFSLKRMFTPPKAIRKLTLKKVIKPLALVAAGALLAPVILPVAGAVAGGTLRAGAAAGRGLFGAAKGIFGKWKLPAIPKTKPITIPAEVLKEAQEAATAGAAALTTRAVQSVTEALQPSAPVPTPAGPTPAPGYEEAQQAPEQPAGAPSNLPMILGVAAAAGLGLMLLTKSQRSRA